VYVALEEGGMEERVADDRWECPLESLYSFQFFPWRNTSAVEREDCVLFEVEWELRSLAKSTPWTHCLVLSVDARVAASLVGPGTTLVQHGAGNKGKSVIKADLTKEGHIAELLSSEPWSVVCLMVRSCSSPAAAADVSLEVSKVLALTKTVLSLKSSRPPRIITTSIGVSTAPGMAPTDASICCTWLPGFVKSVLLEHSDLPLSLVDLEGDRTSVQLSSLMKGDISLPHSEPEVAIRGTRLLVPRLRYCEVPFRKGIKLPPCGGRWDLHCHGGSWRPWAAAGQEDG